MYTRRRQGEVGRDSGAVEYQSSLWTLSTPRAIADLKMYDPTLLQSAGSQPCSTDAIVPVQSHWAPAVQKVRAIVLAVAAISLGLALVYVGPLQYFAVVAHTPPVRTLSTGRPILPAYVPSRFQSSSHNVHIRTAAAVEVADEGKKATLVERIGGEQAVKIAVDMFDDRLRKNSATSKWLEGDNAALFVELQADFMRFALTGIPPNVDVGKFMATKHVALFRKGLSCDDFDNFAEVLQGVLKDLKVNDDVVEEVLVNVLPLRAVFAVEVQKVANAKQAQALNLVGGLFIVAAYVLLREGGK